MKHRLVSVPLLVILAISASADTPWISTNHTNFQYQIVGEHGVFLRNISNQGVEVDWAIWYTSNSAASPERGRQYIGAESKAQIAYSNCSETGDRKCIDRVDVHPVEK